MKKKKLTFPDFDKMTYEEEAAWWDTHDTGLYATTPVDMVFELDKPRTATVVIRMQDRLKYAIGKMARAKGLDTSSLIRSWIMEKMRAAR